MNCALIFAGGTGQRMNTRTKPKQFLELHGKPVIIYTIEHFENHPGIDEIVIVCLKDSITYLQQLIERFHIQKVREIVPGGGSAQESTQFGIERMHELYPKETLVLIHDGVRPLIDAETITKNIDCAQKHGNCITVTPATETIVMTTPDGNVDKIVNRSLCQMARAPQTFVLSDIYEAQQKAMEEALFHFIDSASLMMHYQHALHTTQGPWENIKITMPGDFYIFRALEDSKENMQILGF